MIKLHYLFATFLSRKNFIDRGTTPFCVNCLHFIEHKNNYSYDDSPSDKNYGRCNKFGKVNLVTGTIEYDFAKNCREDDNKCGKNGLEYKGKPHIDI